MEEKNIHKKVDEVLQSLDHINRAAPRPFLFTRLEARMQNERNIWSRLSSFVARPVIAFACVCFIIILNAMVIYLSNNTVNFTQGSDLATADEYSQVSTTFYEFENAKP